MITQQHIEGQWNELKGQLRQAWGQLTDSELTEFKGSVDDLVGLIQQKTGQTRQVVEKRLDAIAGELSGFTARAAEAVKEAATQVGQGLYDGYQSATDTVSEQYHRAERVVHQRPMESMAVAFASGLIAGVIVTLVSRSR